MDDKQGMVRTALLKELLKAIGSNRIKGFSVEKVDLHDPKEEGPEEEEAYEAPEVGEAKVIKANSKSDLIKKVKETIGE